ncbi:PKD domain-containing protein [Dokdonia sp.]|uniref:PKD domain-containing protein n=1 Tax=Dokdonia sp. TaxID=2024995 RepID=UPI0032637C4E
MNKLNNITTQYRKFSKGQYIEHTQFNEFLDYFEDQDRLSKTLLRGVGLACGFEYQLTYVNTRISKGAKIVDGIEISQGVGITTDGDLITLSDISKVSDELGGSDLKTIDINSKLYSYSKTYDNSKANYAPFYDDDGNQIPLWELSETNNSANEYTPVSESSDSILNALYLLIYIESYEKEVRPCRGVDCDNHGLEQVQNVKVLFTTLTGIKNIVAKEDTLYRHSLHAASPELRLKRALANAELNSIDDFKNIYADIVLDQDLLGEMSSGISAITSHFRLQNNFNIASITTLLESVIALNDDSILGFQYAYDFVKDLVETYTEIKALLPKSFTNCFPDMNAFPKHLMIGKVVSNTSENYRHEFYNSPVLDDKEIADKVKLLIQRFNQLIDKFTAPLPEINKKARVINITPSRKSIQLGSKAIPFYYELDEEFFKRWSYDKTRHRISDRNLTYNDLSPLLSDDLSIQEAITFNLEKNTFYRIEGHQSQSYDVVASELNAKKEEHQLSFDVMSLSLEELKDNKDLSKAYYKEYVEKHPGIEHASGVEPGGTFVIVYQSEINPEVIADFSLPYLCCGPKLDVDLSLPLDEICVGSKPIPFTVSPLDGVVAAVVSEGIHGGVVKVGQQYMFDPSVVDSSLLDQEITFTVNGKPTDASIRVLSKLDIQIEATSVTVTNLLATVVTFTITSLNDSDINDYEYQWDFLNNGNFVPKVPVNGVVTYSYSRALKVIPNQISVLVSGNGCSETIDVIIPDQNKAPTADAGPDETITLPTSTVTLNGSGSSDSDGSISHSWSKITAASATIVNPTNASTQVTGLVFGTHMFQLTVTDNLGLTDTDTVTITVNRANVAPVADAGPDETITLPLSTVTLDGSNSDDQDGSITSYSWSKATQSVAIITNPTDPSTTVTGLTVGTHVFQLTVTDNNLATSTDTVQIEVEKEVTVPDSFYVGLGKCKVTPADWTAVWTPSGNVADSYIPVIGDILYTDSSFNNPYSPVSVPNRLGFSALPDPLMDNNSYNINASGIITSITNCDISTGDDDAEIIGSIEETSCESCMSVSVNVPEGETREVSITRLGMAGYSGGSVCRNGTVVVSDINETISETKIYSFGLDVASGDESTQSSIILSVVGSNSVTLNRSHGSRADIC